MSVVIRRYDAVAVQGTFFTQRLLAVPAFVLLLAFVFNPRDIYL